MSSIIINESELVKLVEVAMDISRYREPIQYSDGEENKSAEDATKDIIQILKELLSIIQSNRKLTPQDKSMIFKSYDILKNTHDKIKFKKNFT
jgi:hypothetical protein